MRLSPTDASFVYLESVSGPMHISSIYVLDGEVAYEDVLRRFEARIHLIPTYRQKLLHVPFNLGHPKWVDDPDFDLQNHVLSHEVPKGTTFEEAFDIAVHLNEEMYDRSRPLWKVVVITGVPGKTLYLQGCHHAMIDGASGIELTQIIFDLTPDAEEPTPPEEEWQPEESQSAGELIAEAVRENIANLAKVSPWATQGPVGAQWRRIQHATEVMTQFVTRPAMTAPFNAGMVGPKRRVRWLKRPFSEIREIRRQLGGTINDIVLTVVSEAVARYLQKHEEETDGRYIRIMCPVNVRTEDQKGALGNQVSAIYPYLPAWNMSAFERLTTVIGETTRIKSAADAEALTVFQERMSAIPPLGMMGTQLVGTPFDPTVWAARYPPPVMPSMGSRPPLAGYNFTCTNVPGVQVPQYMCGVEVTDTIGLLVLTGNIGFSATILSYNKQLFFSFISEPRLMPDVEVVESYAEEVFDELLTLAQEKQAQSS